MTSKDSCKKSGNVIFTALVNGSKTVFNVQPTLIATAFKGTLQEEFKLAKSMLKSKVRILYCLADNKVITIDRADE